MLTDKEISRIKREVRQQAHKYGVGDTKIPQMEQEAILMAKQEKTEQLILQDYQNRSDTLATLRDIKKLFAIQVLVQLLSFKGESADENKLLDKISGVVEEMLE